MKASDAYYTTIEVAEKYDMIKSNICVVVKTNNLTKVKAKALRYRRFERFVNERYDFFDI